MVQPRFQTTAFSGQLQLVVTDDDGAITTAIIDFKITAQVAFTHTQAARFLTHATFGPRSAEITALGNNYIIKQLFTDFVEKHFTETPIVIYCS